MAQRFTPQEIADKWSRKMGQAGPDYVAGIDRVTRAPGEAAAANQAGYQAGINEAITSGKWANRVRSVSLETWRQAAKDKGSARLTQGAAAAVSKVADAHARIAPMLDQAGAKIANMPRATTADRINRMVAHAQEMNRAAKANAGRR